MWAKAHVSRGFTKGLSQKWIKPKKNDFSTKLYLPDNGSSLY